MDHREHERLNIKLMNKKTISSQVFTRNGKFQIIEDFPELSENQIKACLSYAADREHKIQIVS